MRQTLYISKKYEHDHPSRAHHLRQETEREYVSECGNLRLSKSSARVTEALPDDRKLCGHCAKLRP